MGEGCRLVRCGGGLDNEVNGQLTRPGVVDLYVGFRLVHDEFYNVDMYVCFCM